MRHVLLGAFLRQVADVAERHIFCVTVIIRVHVQRSYLPGGIGK